MIPSPEQSARRLAQILKRGSVNLGDGPGHERLMLMLTRSCELRCGYCLVQKMEDAENLSLDLAKQGIDLLMKSARPGLEVQFFGGEPTRSWFTTHAMKFAVLDDLVLAGQPHMVSFRNGGALT